MKHLCSILVALLLSVASFAITGPANLCVSTYTPFSDATPGGTWSSSNPGIASVQVTSGLVHAVTAGTTTLTYTTGVGISTFTVTVVTALPGITPASPAVCTHATLALSNSVSGGTWSSSVSSMATIDPATGVVYGAAHGSSVISYTIGGACVTSKSVTVSDSLNAITGPTTMCAGNTIYLSVGGASGSWSGSNTFANVYTTGAVWATGTGSVLVTFTNSSSCGAPSLTYNITISPAIPANGGPSNMCSGTTALLSNAVSGGVWTSSNSSIATVDPVTGLVSATTNGWVGITYTAPGGCYYTTSMTVGATATSITGASSLCSGSATALAVTGSTSGTWSSSNTTIATVGTTGIVYGVSAGSATITFHNVSSCGTVALTHPITVIAGVSITSGPLTACVGSVVPLSNATAGGTWSTLTPSIATVNASGSVTTLTVGEAFIRYGVSSGCAYTHTIYVVAAAGAISGLATTCAGSSISLSNSTPGGGWSSSNTAIATVSASGYVYGVAAGAVTITYNSPTGCSSFVTHAVSVSTAPSAISGPASLCAGATAAYTNPTPGGTWSSAAPSIATIDAAGIATALMAGTAYLQYHITPGCYAQLAVAVAGGAGNITGASSVCLGTTSQLSSSPAGGTWTSSAPAVATVNSSTGLIGGVSTGTAVISYNLVSGCTSTLTVSVGSSLVINTTVTPMCAGGYIITASGGITYSWSPAGILSCSACASNSLNPVSTTTLVVTGTTPACSGTATVVVNGNRIRGNISYSGTSSDIFRVWLVKYDPTDSSVLAVDSTLSCMSGTTPFYQFASPAPGAYSVKAKLLSSVPGSSGYIPTYGLSSANWFSAATINHTTNTDVQPINMIYGTVPAGPGFIAGNVYFGAGKGTTGEAPAADMLIYLRNTATNVLTYTYTDALGAYSFTGLAYGDYVIYPEEYDYYTTPSAIISLNAASPSASGVNFKQHTDNGTITPFTNTGLNAISRGADIHLYPNPVTNTLTISWAGATAGEAYVTITDVTGRAVKTSVIEINTQAGRKQVDIADLSNGLYMISVRSATINYNSKIEVRH